MSDPARWHRLEQLFDEALARDSGERVAWLAAACADDAVLHAEVAAMLAAHERTGGLLDRVAAPPAVPLHPAELARRLEDAIADRYIVERELGRGGAATVFLAHERKHARRVVLKVLNPEIAALWGRERFDREVQIAARLSDPHILGLIDSGEADGLLYYVMPHVEGETLRARLDRRGALPLAEAAQLLHDVAGALAHAHRAGVVHRDLKPANVLCVGEHAFLMDFGVAKLITPVHGEGELTGQGLAVGTPAYMAPEQLAAHGGVDGRADLYAWGLLAHEMLAGELPATGARAHDAGTSALMRPGVPRALAELVAACLSPDPQVRPASAEIVLDRLRRATMPPRPRGVLRALARVGRARRRYVRAGVLTALAGVVAVASIAAWRRVAPPAGPGLAAPIAVSVFTNETGDAALDVWGRMAGDWITQGIQQTGLVPVVAWPTALEASERLQAARRSGRVASQVDFLRDELRAGTVVSGAYYLAGDTVHFRVEVTDALTGRVVAAPPPVTAPRDSAIHAVRELRDRVMSAVAISTDGRMTRAADLVRRPPTFEAYQAFDRGLQLYVASRYRDAVPELRRALALDTNFTVAALLAGLAHWNVSEFASADSMVRLTLGRVGELGAYDRASAEAVAALLEGDGQRAREAYRRAAEAAPGSKGWYNFAMAALETDRPHEALAALESLEPDRGPMKGWAPYWTQLAHTRHLLGEHERELEAAREMRRRYPERRVAHVLEARALAALGRTAALDSLDAETRALAPGVYWSQGAAMVSAGQELRIHGHEAAGRAWTERGVRWLEQQRALAPEVRGHREWLFDGYYSLGRWAAAAEQAEALVAEAPGRLAYRGRAALAAARLGRPDAERDLILEPAPPYGRSDELVYRARLAAIRGDAARAGALLAEASRLGLNGVAWDHTGAHPELAALARAGVELPVTLRLPAAAGAPAGASAGAPAAASNAARRP